MGKSNIEQQLQTESELVRDESMMVLKEFEDIDDFGLGCYSSVDSKPSFNFVIMITMSEQVLTLK